MHSSHERRHWALCACCRCPTGYKPSKPELDKRISHLQWTRKIEMEAAREVKAGEKAYRREQRAKQRANAPEDESGKALW